MGCGTSSVDSGQMMDFREGAKDDGELKLPYSKICFSPRQLSRLNEKFCKLVESASASESLKEKQMVHVGVVVERLVQRLICNVGSLDTRFSSKFLVTLQSPHTQAPGKRLSFKYLVRVDALSSPALYPEYFRPPVKIAEGSGMDSLPHGYIKVRVHGEYLEQWSEFINPTGFLRRDKIQERFIELLARAAARPTEPTSPVQVDESRLCGSPGKIIDPVTLYHTLKLPPSQQMFYGPGECNESRFPDPRDFRIAIVEGTPETSLHVSFLSPTAQTLIGEGDVEIVLTLAIGATGWPTTSDFPSRYPLDHVDVILAYQSAQMDYFVVPKGPPQHLRCEERTTLWEVRALPTEFFLEYHYSPNSAIGRIYKILPLLLHLLRSRGVKTVDRYILKNLLLFELETKKRIEEWTPGSISRRILMILDNLLRALRNQSLPSYFFNRKNLLLQDGTLEEDYVSDGDILEHYIRHLSRDHTDNSDDCYVTIKDQLENVMLEKWTSVVSNLLPPVSNRGRRLSVPGTSVVSVSYTRRQMEYVALLFREILRLKHVQQKQCGREIPPGQEESREQASTVEDVVFLLQIVFAQAKNKTFSDMTRWRNCDGNRKKLKLAQMMRSYDVSTSMLIDEVRRSRQAAQQIEDDMSLVATVIECLYKATDSDGRVLGPVIRPYLNQLFRGSHENCWFLPEWKKKMEELEFQAIGAFTSLVISGNIDPLSGILDSAKKGWNWARNCVRLMQSIRSENCASVIIGEKIDLNESGLRIVFAPRPEETIRFRIALPRMDLDDTTGEGQYLTCPRRNRISSYATIRSFSGDFHNSKDLSDGASKPSWEKYPPHAKLRDSSPLTFASMEARRRGTHRGLGSIVQALISLQKLTVLQEISQFLPQEEKRKVLNDIKKLSKEVHRLTVSSHKKRNLSLARIDPEAVDLTVAALNHSRNAYYVLDSYPLLPSKRTYKSRMNLPGFWDFCSNIITYPFNLHVFALVKQQEIDRMARPKWRSATLPGRMRSSVEVAVAEGEVYRSLNEFSFRGEREGEEVVGVEDDTRKAKEDTLVGTCRLLRRQQRTRLFGPEHSLGTGRLGKASATLPKNTINTPFYLRVTNLDREQHTARRHAGDLMQF